jgi:hypothetical protein
VATGRSVLVWCGCLVHAIERRELLTTLLK